MLPAKVLKIPLGYINLRRVLSVVLVSVQILELDNIKTHHWQIIWCSAVTGENLLQGIDWLIGDIAMRIFTLD